MYQLKKGQENFTPVEGAFAKKQYFKGVSYEAGQIPPEEKNRVAKIAPAPEPVGGGTTNEKPGLAKGANDAPAKPAATGGRK